MSETDVWENHEPVEVVNADGSSSVVLVCEHASSFIPPSFRGLGLQRDALESHAVWDPGAMGVARRLAQVLDAVLVAGTVSRLVYDCNRPPQAADAIRAKSERVEVPGNVDLSQSERIERVNAVYAPFRATLARTIARVRTPVLVTVHSFTPVYHGQKRSVEIGVLHDEDSRLADSMMAAAQTHTQANVQRNQPYGPSDGVTHTLKEHALPQGHLNVMLEIRNDLIQTPEAQRDWADVIAHWLVDAFAETQAEGDVRCTV